VQDLRIIAELWKWSPVGWLLENLQQASNF